MSEIILNNSNSQVIIKPKAGGLISAWTVKNEPILYEDTIIETPQGDKRRGGIPLLFPNAGPIIANKSELKLFQHGFAREMPWQVESKSKNTVKLSLCQNASSRQQYPFDFLLESTISIGRNNLEYRLVVQNNSEQSMPIAPGFHPYFYSPFRSREQIVTNIDNFSATNHDWTEVKYFSRPDVVKFTLANKSFKIECSPEFKIIAIWSDGNGEYVCIEPWVGLPGAILDPIARINIAPGQTQTLFMRISLVSNQ